MKISQPTIMHNTVVAKIVVDYVFIRGSVGK